MIQQHRKIVTTHDHDGAHAASEAKFNPEMLKEKWFENLKTSKSTLKDILEEVLCVDGGNHLTDKDVENVIAEVSSSAYQDITFEDFLKMFKSSS